MHFFKYHGAGNDFIVVDNRKQGVHFVSSEQIAALCDRHTGIGADGLIILEGSDQSDFRMLYYNADGHEGSMCGNGGRCIVSFSRFLGLINTEARFEASDGIHVAQILENGTFADRVSLHMNSVHNIERIGDDYILDTGSPHFVKFVENVGAVDVYEEGRKIRYGDHYRKTGINVNFVEPAKDKIKIRTYERGVEDETRACGTGSVAAAISFYLKTSGKSKSPILVQTLGGDLEINFRNVNGSFEDVVLTGEAVRVFQGSVDLKSFAG
jgi:diaminopimelate epimerase